MTDNRKENQWEVLNCLIARYREKATSEPMMFSPRLTRDEIHTKVSGNLSLGDVHLAIEDLEHERLVERHQVRGTNAPPKFSVKEEFVKYQSLLATLGGLGRPDDYV